MTPKPSVLFTTPWVVIFLFLFGLFFYLLISLLLLLFSKFTYRATEDYIIKEFSDDGIVNLGSPPSEQYTVTKLVPDTFYKFYFNGISSCGQSLSQIMKAKTFASGKLGPISYLYVFLLQRENYCHPI